MKGEEMASASRSDRFLDTIREVVSPEVFTQISARLKDAAVDDNQNQNQNQGLEDMAQLKPAVLREIAFGSSPGEEVMDNQNQNQGKLAELMKLKPDVLRQLRVTLRGEEVMDNQNQNQGSEQALERSKPRI
jgi:ribosomal protein S6